MGLARSRGCVRRYRSHADNSIELPIERPSPTSTALVADVLTKHAFVYDSSGHAEHLVEGRDRARRRRPPRAVPFPAASRRPEQLEHFLHDAVDRAFFAPPGSVRRGDRRSESSLTRRDRARYHGCTRLVVIEDPKIRRAPRQRHHRTDRVKRASVKTHVRVVALSRIERAGDGKLVVRRRRAGGEPVAFLFFVPSDPLSLVGFHHCCRLSQCFVLFVNSSSSFIHPCIICRGIIKSGNTE